MIIQVRSRYSLDLRSLACHTVSMHTVIEQLVVGSVVQELAGTCSVVLRCSPSVKSRQFLLNHGRSGLGRRGYRSQPQDNAASDRWRL